MPAALAEPTAHAAWYASLYAKDWVVYAKPPFGGPAQVLKYLARYTHRVAISNSRLLELRDGRVTFRYKDYADDHRQKTMTLDAEEFLRRFVQHVLPKGFVKIRHYGLLANRPPRGAAGRVPASAAGREPGRDPARPDSTARTGPAPLLPAVRRPPAGLPRAARRTKRSAEPTAADSS